MALKPNTSPYSDCYVNHEPQDPVLRDKFRDIQRNLYYKYNAGEICDLTYYLSDSEIADMAKKLSQIRIDDSTNGHK